MSYLSTYNGSWSYSEARHLLSRAVFGPSNDMIDEAVGLGLTGTIEKLFEELPTPGPPLKNVPDGIDRNSIDDPGVKFGETWLNGKPFPEVETQMLRNRILRYRALSLYSWTFLEMYKSGMNIRDKMFVFWHNHFVVGQTQIPHMEYNYQNLLRKHALGNFKQLTKDITIDTSMLVYLSGNENSNRAPNENYSRELLELFTIGKGELVGPGDYSNYTEEDVIEMAKVLTGWRLRNVLDENFLEPLFLPSRHTIGSKALSKYFGNVMIQENGPDEYKDLIDVIFQHPECAKFISRKLYRWFVNWDINEDIEKNVIEPLAAVVRDNNYEIAPAVRVLLSSEHFFEQTACMIKSPIDLVLSVTRGMGVDPPQNSVKEEYDYAIALYSLCAELEQGLYQHPDVAGWKAYYQEPLYYKTWINNLLLPKRFDYAKALIAGGTLMIGNNKYQIPPIVPVLEIVTKIDNAGSPDILINELAKRFYNYPISEEQVAYLKNILIPGLPDYEWTVEYNLFLENPNDINLALSVDSKLRSMISVMVQMSEFQII